MRRVEKNMEEGELGLGEMDDGPGCGGFREGDARRKGQRESMKGETEVEKQWR